LNYVEKVLPVRTNIVIFSLKNKNAVDFVGELEKLDIIAAPFGPKEVRFVTHKHFDEEQMESLKKKLKGLE